MCIWIELELLNSFSLVLCKNIYQIEKLESYTMHQDCVFDTKLTEYRLVYWTAKLKSCSSGYSCWAHLFATKLK